MADAFGGYEMAVGLETHVELKTASKAFCGCANRFGAAPNTLCCPVCMGLPGALPRLNRQALLLAARAGAALGCEIHTESRFDRKHYFYPDLPKGYQITQNERPLCENGFVSVRAQGAERRVGIARLHLEEDAGKLLHDPARGALLDLNRAGVPLIEIVTRPDIRSGKEAAAYLRKLRAVLLCAGVSDCKMNEGSLRCDVNISVRRPGAPLGTRTELKNLNSFQSVERAIAAEFARQAALLEAGEAVLPETRRFDPQTGQTAPMRRKEDSGDYLFLPEADLPPAVLTRAEIENIRASLPRMPDQRQEEWIRAYGLTPWAAEQLTAEPWITSYYERAAKAARHPEAAANLLLGEAFALRNQRRSGDYGLPVAPEHLARLGDMAAEGRVNSSMAKRILAALFDADEEPEAYAARHGLFQLTDTAALSAAVQRVLDKNPELAEAYRGGKAGVEKALMGRAMAETRGSADPVSLRALLLEALNPSQNP